LVCKRSAEPASKLNIGTGEESGMNIWIRVFSSVETDGLNTEGSSLTLNAATCLCIYMAEHLARAAQQARGGIVLEALASSLRGQFEAGDAMLLIDELESEERPGPRTAHASVVYDGIRPGADSADQIPWLVDLQRELGVRLYQ
jgi:hypothetical protein